MSKYTKNISYTKRNIRETVLAKKQWNKYKTRWEQSQNKLLRQEYSQAGCQYFSVRWNIKNINRSNNFIANF